MQPFNAGPRVGHYYVVISGLEDDQKIVFEGVQGLRDGMKINPVEEI